MNPLSMMDSSVTTRPPKSQAQLEKYLPDHLSPANLWVDHICLKKMHLIFAGSVPPWDPLATA